MAETNTEIENTDPFAALTTALTAALTKSTEDKGLADRISAIEAVLNPESFAATLTKAVEDAVAPIRTALGQTVDQVQELTKSSALRKSADGQEMTPVQKSANAGLGAALFAAHKSNQTLTLV